MKATWFLAAAIAAISIAKSAQASFITNATTSTTVLYETYENQTPGSQATSANISPGPGTSNSVTGAVATNAAIPGAFEGLKYLEIDRKNGAVGGSSTRLQYTLSAPIPVGETMHASFAYQLVSGYFEAIVFGSGTNIFGIYASPADNGGKWQTFTGAGATDQIAASLTVGDLNVWHTLDIDYVAGATSVTLTRDGQSETISGITSVANANRSVTLFRYAGDGSSTSHFYVDAVVPEPISISLSGIGVLGSCLAVRRRHRSRK